MVKIIYYYTTLNILSTLVNLNIVLNASLLLGLGNCIEAKQ